MRRVLALAATLVVAAIGLLPGAAGSAPAAPGFPPLRPTKVLILGDSVMKGAVSQYNNKLPGRDVVVDAEVNRSTGQGADVVARLGADWDVVVVLLGHNDGGTPGAYQPAARRILDQLRGVRRVSWLTIHEVRPYYPAVNHYIAGLQSMYPNLRVGDWNAVASANPGALASDGLHLNGQGAVLMADLVAQQVQVAELEWQGALRALAPKPTTTTTLQPTTTTTAPPTTTTTTEPPTTTTSEAQAAETTEPTTAQASPGATTKAIDDTSGNQAGVYITLGMLAAWAGVGLWGVHRFRRKAKAQDLDRPT